MSGIMTGASVTKQLLVQGQLGAREAEALRLLLLHRRSSHDCPRGVVLAFKMGRAGMMADLCKEGGEVKGPGTLPAIRAHRQHALLKQLQPPAAHTAAVYLVRFERNAECQSCSSSTNA